MMYRWMGWHDKEKGRTQEKDSMPGGQDYASTKKKQNIILVQGGFRGKIGHSIASPTCGNNTTGSFKARKPLIFSSGQLPPRCVVIARSEELPRCKGCPKKGVSVFPLEFILDRPIERDEGNAHAPRQIPRNFTSQPINRRHLN
jgi:hypothetical protein